MATGKKTGGREKGTPNRVTASLKDAVLNAFEEVGGEKYLVKVAEDDPRTFCVLLGKILPKDISYQDSDPIITEVRRVIVSSCDH